MAIQDHHQPMQAGAGDIFEAENARMGKALQVLNSITEMGVIGGYAIGGAVGAMFYVEPFLTRDLDTFVLLRQGGSREETRALVFGHFASLGHTPAADYVSVDGLKVQFIVERDALDREAVKRAVPTVWRGVSTFIIDPEHLVALFVRAGRFKDFDKIERMEMQTGLDRARLRRILKKHGLTSKWKQYKEFPGGD